MIEQIQIDGFKSFKEFTLNVPPLLVVAGTNASGKSNLLDALRLLAEAEVDHNALFRSTRGTAVQLLRTTSQGRFSEEFHIGAALSVLDASKTVRRFNPGFHVELKESGPRELAFHAVFSADTGGSAADRDLVGRELGSWLFLDPVSSRLRARADGTDLGRLAPDASNLAAVLGRFSESDTLAELMLDVRAVIPALDDIVPVRDHRGDWDYDLCFRNGGRMAPAMASDGTLRVLALFAAMHDPDHPGTVVVDEIENGLHPSRLSVLLSRIADLTTTDRRGVARQVLVTTHSPVVVSHMLAEERDSVVFFDSVFHPEESGALRVGSMVTRARGVRETGERGTYVTTAEVRNYLETVRRDAW